MRHALSFFVLLLSVAPAAAHGPSGWTSASHWNADPLVLGPLLISGALYFAGVARLWRHAGAARGVRPWQVASFVGGWTALVIALLSPLDWLASRLFVAHMIEHEIVMVVAAPLIAIARPFGAMLWALPPRARRLAGACTQSIGRTAAWRFVSAPVAATFLHGAGIWIWHAPALYDAVLASNAVHRLQHLTFFITALLFWWSLASGRAQNAGTAIGCLLVTMMHTGFLGMLLTFSRSVWYPTQGSAAAAFGLTPLEDQQLAGLVMWLPGGAIYLTAALALAFRALRELTPSLPRAKGAEQ